LAKPILSHYSPKFSNKAWADNNEFISYYRCPHKLTVEKSIKGRKEWGRKRGLYIRAVEDALNRELENEAAPIYEKILEFGELNASERVIWAQFLLSQLVRTPTYMRYEKLALSISGCTESPSHDRVGCRECDDLNFVVNRDWCLLLAHEDDIFVRSDNPVFQTGFIERPETCLFYPLSPKVCFVACSMHAKWDGYSDSPSETRGVILSKGGAHFINFHLAKATGESLIVSPKHDGDIADGMYRELLGAYPQPPFSLHRLERGTTDDDAYESVRMIMSRVDHYDYPKWRPMELEPFFCNNIGAS
jgi:hypothetical protein